MSEVDLTNISSASISTPSAGLLALFADTDKKFKQKDDTGFVRSYFNNWSTASQAPAASTRTYVTGSNLPVGTAKLQVGTMFRWRITMTKTAAGVAASTFDICFGTAATTADTARVSFTKPAGTAAVDEGVVEIFATVRSIGAAGVVVGEFILHHNGNTAGHATTPQVVLNTISSGFDTTVANLIAGVCITTGASDAITIQAVQAEAWNV